MFRKAVIAIAVCAVLLCFGWTQAAMISAEDPREISVSEGTSVTIWELSGVYSEWTISVETLTGEGAHRSTVGWENYFFSSDGDYLNIWCDRYYNWLPEPYDPISTGNNIVAIRLNGVTGYPDGLWASFVLNYSLGDYGSAASISNALGSFTQLGPYRNSPCTYVGDHVSTFNVGFAEPGCSPLPPVADAGEDITCELGTPVLFDGSNSSASGGILSLLWSFDSGGKTVHLEGTSASYVFPLDVEFEVTLTAFDVWGQWANDTVMVYVEPGDPTGILRVTTSPLVPGMIYVDGHWMCRRCLDWVKLAPGEYTLSFGDVLGYVTPEDQNVTVVAGEVSHAEGVYTAMGSLRVVTDPAVPSTIYVNGLPRNEWGFWNYVPAGTYEVSFGSVADMATPSPQTVTVIAGGFQQVVGAFTSSPGAPGPDPASYGMLRVTSNPPVPTMIYLNGEWMSHWGLDWVKLAPGEYTVSFSDAMGALTPEPVNVSIVANMTTYCNAVFQLTGILRVMTSPPVASTIFVNDIPRNGWGLWIDVPAGTYAVGFGYVENLTTPFSRTVTVWAGGYTETTGMFT